MVSNVSFSNLIVLTISLGGRFPFSRYRWASSFLLLIVTGDALDASTTKLAIAGCPTANHSTATTAVVMLVDVGVRRGEAWQKGARIVILLFHAYCIADFVNHLVFTFHTLSHQTAVLLFTKQIYAFILAIILLVEVARFHRIAVAKRRRACSEFG